MRALDHTSGVELRKALQPESNSAVKVRAQIAAERARVQGNHAVAKHRAIAAHLLCTIGRR